MEDYPKYSKRQFLKILGLGIAFLPLMSCFTSEENKTIVSNDAKDKNSEKPQLPEPNPDDILLLQRHHDAYAQYNQGFNKRLHFLPKYIAVCFTEKGVQYAVQLAKQEQLPVAVKSGGHSFEGFSSNDGGLVINVSQMKAIHWLSEGEIEIQPGVLLQDLHQELFPKNKLLPTGSCGTVAIAGLTLGGGYGFFSRKFGLTCDSLQEIKLVTADGKTHSTKEDSQLLWACKGGGNGNFGVVTTFRFSLFEAPESFSTLTLKFRNLNPSRFSELLHLWFTQTELLDKEAFSAFVLNGQTLTILATTYGNSQVLEQQMTPLVSQADKATRNFHQTLVVAMKRYYGRKGPINFKNASAGMYQQQQDLSGIEEALFNLVKNTPGIIFQINTLGGDIADPSFERASSFPHRGLPYLGELQAYWDQDEREPELLKAFSNIQALIEQQGIRAHYRNYPDIHFSNWEQAYYGTAYKKLQQIKRKYDPENLFQYPQSIQPDIEMT